MKAYIVDRYKSNSALRLGDIPEPEVRDHDVLVAVIWTWNGEFGTAKGETVTTRSVDTPISPTSYSFKWQIRGADGDWVTLQEGTATKLK